MTSPEEFLLIGRVSAVFGVQGQVKVRAVTDKPDHLRRHIRTLYLGDAHRPYSLTKVFEHKPGLLIMTLGGITTRDAAEELVGSELFIRENEAAPLEQDEYYIHELYGLHVFTEDGAELGTVREVLETGANEVLVVARRGQSDALLPMIRDVVQRIDIPNKRVVVRLLEGLL